MPPTHTFLEALYQSGKITEAAIVVHYARRQPANTLLHGPQRQPFSPCVKSGQGWGRLQASQLPDVDELVWADRARLQRRSNKAHYYRTVQRVGKSLNFRGHPSKFTRRLVELGVSAGEGMYRGLYSRFIPQKAKRRKRRRPSTAREVGKVVDTGLIERQWLYLRQHRPGFSWQALQVSFPAPHLAHLPDYSACRAVGTTLAYFLGHASLPTHPRAKLWSREKAWRNAYLTVPQFAPMTAQRLAYYNLVWPPAGILDPELPAGIEALKALGLAPRVIGLDRPLEHIKRERFRGRLGKDNRVIVEEVPFPPIKPKKGVKPPAPKIVDYESVEWVRNTPPDSEDWHYTARAVYAEWHRVHMAALAQATTTKPPEHLTERRPASRRSRRPTRRFARIKTSPSSYLVNKLSVDFSIHFENYSAINQPTLSFFPIKRRSYKKKKKIMLLKHELKITKATNRFGKLMSIVKNLYFRWKRRKGFRNWERGMRAFVVKEVLSTPKNPISRYKSVTHEKIGREAVNVIIFRRRLENLT